MSSVRYRSHSHASPQITQRILQHDFELVGDVMDRLGRVQLRRAYSLAHGLATTHATFAAQLPSAVVVAGPKSIWNGSNLALTAFKNSNEHFPTGFLSLFKAEGFIATKC